MTDEEKEMQEEYLDFAMEPLMDEVADFLDKQKKKHKFLTVFSHVFLRK